MHPNIGRCCSSTSVSANGVQKYLLMRLSAMQLHGLRQRGIPRRIIARLNETANRALPPLSVLVALLQCSFSAAAFRHAVGDHR
jgi:hypothetical protein